MMNPMWGGNTYGQGMGSMIQNRMMGMRPQNFMQNVMQKPVAAGGTGLPGNTFGGGGSTSGIPMMNGPSLIGDPAGQSGNMLQQLGGMFGGAGGAPTDPGMSMSGRAGMGDPAQQFNDMTQQQFVPNTTPGFDSINQLGSISQQLGDTMQVHAADPTQQLAMTQQQFAQPAMNRFTPFAGGMNGGGGGLQNILGMLMGGGRFGTGQGGIERGNVF